MVAEWETAGVVAEAPRVEAIAARIDALQGRIRQLEATLRELERDAESLDWHYSPVAQEMGRVMRRRIEEVL
jgi:prefoldin subunit 5